MSGVYALKEQHLVRVDRAEAVEEAPRKVTCPLAQPAPFFRSLAFLMRSGYPLGRGLDLLGQGMERAADQQVCRMLERHITEGMSFPQAFRATGFPDDLVCALEAGEVAGRIEEAMDWYASFEESNEAIKREVKQALLNPLFTLAGSILFALLLPPLVLRDQLQMLAQNGAKLPLLSQVLLSFSNAVASPAILLLPALAFAGWVMFRRYVSTLAGRRRFERLMLKVPGLGSALQRASSARCLALMAMILKSGGSPTAAMLIGGKGSGSRLLKDRMQISVHSLIGGIPLTESLHKARWFLRSSIGLMQSGEYCGDTSDMMALAARIEEDKLRDALERVAAVVPPVALLLVGSLVCLMVIAVLGPSSALLSTL